MAGRQPFIKLAMVAEQDLVLVNDENGAGEIDFFVDVGHGLVVSADAPRRSHSNTKNGTEGKSDRKGKCFGR
jgi:hypothetical protein